MKLEGGSIAPLFNTADVYGNPISLTSYRGKKVMLVFFRYAGCPMCAFYMTTLIGKFKTFEEKGLCPIVFFQSPKDHVIEGACEPHKPSFPVIADPKKEIYSVYGVESSITKTLQPANAVAFYTATIKEHFKQKKIDGDFFLLPAEFLINEQGVIHTAHYWQNFADPIATPDIEAFIQSTSKKS